MIDGVAVSRPTRPKKVSGKGGQSAPEENHSSGRPCSAMRRRAAKKRLDKGNVVGMEMMGEI